MDANVHHIRKKGGHIYKGGKSLPGEGNSAPSFLNKMRGAESPMRGEYTADIGQSLIMNYFRECTASAQHDCYTRVY